MAEGTTGDGQGDSFTKVISDSIGRMCLVLLKDFINNRFKQKDVTDAPVVEEREAESKLTEEEQESCKQIGKQLRQIGDDFQKDAELTRQIDCTFGKKMPKVESIMAVANVLFGDNTKISWGRILALFYFVCEMCLRAVQHSLTGGGDLRAWIKELLIEVTLLVIVQFGKWIISQGGWNTILTYFNDNSTPGVAFVSGLAISALAITALFIIYKWKQK